MCTLNKKRIIEIVDCNYINASVLYYFGIEFYNYSEQTLEEACAEKGLKLETVVRRLELNTHCEEIVAINEFPIDLVIEYLKHTHYIFIKQKLPYIGKLIENLNTDESKLAQITKDLKFVFPLFVEDFIHHIYQEEDTLFSYILNLDSFLKGRGNLSKMYFEMERHGLSQYAAEHKEHDDEMLGIRQITHQYSINSDTPLHIRVVYAELESLEKELKTHAKIENEILFLKALALEKDVLDKFHQKIQYN
ncbi:MAG TPA: iron-sulfur cluster repair di-iron protein [Fulvivirga sp.]|nr:iron-sulfur cluster repair di-iron protein [Fulvivirga sp.]